MKELNYVSVKAAMFQGLFFSCFMLFFDLVGDPLIMKEEITFDRWPIKTVSWICFGIIYGFLVRFLQNRKRRINEEKKQINDKSSSLNK